jgi:hypothetical protein
MYLMFADEADSERGRGQLFFVYGAIFVDAARVKALHDGVEAARTCRIRSDRQLEVCRRHEAAELLAINTVS